ncbi:hypothetical protein RUM44_010536 [Polyplax serrata]|uniref:Reversion-inducing cysteine-rich protein with Kazal motifs n=1 Tax=Polyplax serrata TaxID=468196 RepID=A0ABR1AVT4_POLSC
MSPEKACKHVRASKLPISLAAIAADPVLREERLASLHNFCSQQLMQFWGCMNETLAEIRNGEEWSGRQCCLLPQSGKCQKACIRASSREDLVQSCRQSDEINFFTCLDKQEFGDKCCANARSIDCHRSCKLVFKTSLTPNREIRDGVMESCSASSPKVLHCIKNFTKVTPATNTHKYLHCCDKTSESKCRNSCRKILRTKTTGQEIVDSLQEGGCGPPLPHNKFWQCFLHTGTPSETSVSNAEVSRIDRMGMDSAKLYCCNKAASNTCRRLCIKTFSDEWTKSWKDFDLQCLSQPAESRLLHCIDEVEEPCELGCDGLSYCSNFNNRPTELFRSCSPQADEAARYDMALWQQQGYLTLPGGVQILVKNISNCSPDMWKAVACALQVKPCHRQSHINRICREDCYEMLSQCMDWSMMPLGQTAASICSRLASNTPSTPCVSLKPYLEPSDSPYAEPGEEVTAPCKGNPCCKMGEVSQYIVPYGSYVRIPIPTENKGCQKICRCSRDGTIEHCQPMPCVPADNCWLGNKRIGTVNDFGY